MNNPKIYLTNTVQVEIREDLIFASLAKLFSSLNLCIASNTSGLVIMCFIMQLLRITKIMSH